VPGLPRSVGFGQVADAQFEDLIRGWLLPKGRRTEPQPPLDGLAIGAELGEDECDCRAGAAAPRGLLVSRLSARAMGHLFVGRRSDPGPTGLLARQRRRGSESNTL